MKYLKHYETTDLFNSYLHSQNELNKCLELANELEDEVKSSFPFIIDIMDFYTDVYNLDVDTVGIELEFNSTKIESDTIWEDVKYELATLIDYLKDKYKFNMSLLIGYKEGPEDKFDRFNLNEYKDDITLLERDEVFKIILAIKIDISIPERDKFFSKIKNFFKFGKK